jgi:hypothetical protein
MIVDPEIQDKATKDLSLVAFGGWCVNHLPKSLYQ